MTDQPDQESTGPSPRPRWPWIVAGIIIIAFVVVVLLVLLLPHADVETDDAFVRAHYASVTPRVGGQVIRVAVEDTQPVRAGQLLVALDPTDFQVALDEAKGQLAQDKAQLRQTGVEVRQQPSAVTQAAAQLSVAEAAGTLARENSTRYTLLASTGAGSVEQRQQADAQLRQTSAQISSALAGVANATQQLSALEFRREAAAARIQSDQAAIRRAELDLSYTQVRAPIDGVIDQRTVQVGNNVAPGVPIMAVVPLDDIYVEASYREVELRHMRPGQHVRIHVDAYDVDLNGTVQGIAASSDASFSPTPPNNATGNFTKIVQRLPVRILIDPDQPNTSLLRVGMSVTAIVETKLHDVVARRQWSRERGKQ